MPPQEVEIEYIGKKDPVDFSFPWDTSAQQYHFRTGQKKMVPYGVAKRLVEEGPQAFRFTAPSKEQRKALPEEKHVVPRETSEKKASEDEDTGPDIIVGEDGGVEGGETHPDAQFADESEGGKMLDEEKDLPGLDLDS